MRRHFPREQSAWIEDLFDSLSPDERSALNAAGVQHILDEGDRLPEVTDAIVRVESGMVKLALAAEHRRLTVWLFGPSDTVCLPLYHSWPDGIYHLEAQEPSAVRVIPRQAVLEAAAANPAFAAGVMRHLSWIGWQLVNALRMLAFCGLRQRVAQVLVNLAAIFGRPDPRGGIRLGLRFTQEELAELAGARRETLSGILQELREEGILDLRYARIDIRDPEALQRLAGTEPVPFLCRRAE